MVSHKPCKPDVLLHLFYRRPADCIGWRPCWTSRCRTVLDVKQKLFIEAASIKLYELGVHGLAAIANKYWQFKALTLSSMKQTKYESHFPA